MKSSIFKYCMDFQNLKNEFGENGIICDLRRKDCNDCSFDKHYSVIKIPKKNGKERIITIPDERLKLIQKILLKPLFERALIVVDSKTKCYTLSNNDYIFDNGNSSFGFEFDKNIVMNASQHANNKYFFKTDISKFFDSFDVGMVKQTVHYAMKLNEESLVKQFKYNKYLKKHKSKLKKSLKLFVKKDNSKEYKYENYIVSLLIYNGHLATGSPASPALANLYMRKFDMNVNVWLKDLELKTNQKYTYTRYADDICISSNKPINKKVKKYLISELKKYKLSMNESKTVLQSNKAKNVITGVNVTPEGNITVGREKKEEIKYLFYEFMFKSQDEKLYNRLKGNLSYLYQVEPKYCLKMINKYFDLYYKQYPNKYISRTFVSFIEKLYKKSNLDLPKVIKHYIINKKYFFNDFDIPF